jgi:hypothetical protein
MRSGFVLAVVIICGASGATSASPAAAKVAVARGVALSASGDHHGAVVELQRVITEDPRNVLARYYLARAASQEHDLETAVLALVWVANSAAWDDEAWDLARAGATEPDLAWVFEHAPEARRWVGDDIVERIDALHFSDRDWDTHGARDHGRVMSQLARAPGRHDEVCGPEDSKQVWLVGRDYWGEPWGQTIAATLRDGVGIFEGGRLIVRTEPLGCSGVGATGDRMVHLKVLAGAPRMPPKGPPPPAAGRVFIVAEYRHAGPSWWTETAALFTRRDGQLVRVFEGTIARGGVARRGNLTQSPLGDLVYVAPGESRKHVMRWNPAELAFVPIE